jgi:hypothetical protein
LLYAACADDDPAPAPAGIDAGGLDATKADSTASADGTADTSTPQDSGTTDTGTDAAVTDAGADADETGADASLGMGMYMHSAGNLYLLDTADAGITLIGASGATDVRLVWDEGAGIMRGVARALTDPTLVTVDLCTGAVTEGARIVKVNDAGADSGPLVRGECWARRADDTWWAGVDWNGDPPNTPLSESLARFDIDSGSVQRIAFPFKTTQADCDNAVFVGDEFYALDVAQPTTSGIYRIDLNDAGEHKVGVPTPDMVRMGYDEGQATLFCVGSSHKLYRVDVNEAGTTVLGTYLSDASVADSLAMAPIPTCP